MAGHAQRFLPLVFALLAGCATDPKAALPAVQQQVSTAGGPTVNWPQSDAEKSEADRTVQTLLVGELTLDRAVQIAVLNNRGLRATFEEVGLSQAELMQAGRLRNPTLAASVRWPDHTPRGPNVEFSLAADLLDGLLIPLKKKMAGSQLEQATRRVAHEVLTLVTDVKTACYTLQAHQQFRTRVTAIGEVNATVAELAQRQYDAGNINQLELAHHRAAAQHDALVLLRTDAQLRADREKLNRLLGLSGAQAHWKFTAPLPGLPVVESLPDAPEDLAVRQRLDLAAARAQVALTATALDLKRKTRLLPASIQVGVDTERESPGDRLTGPSLEIGLPLFDQGQADLARLEAEWRRGVARVEGLESDIRSEVREALDALAAARASADLYTLTLLPQRTLILHETLLHYNAMQKSNYEVLAAKEQQLSAERESLEALRDYWIARTQLERALGGALPPAAPVAADLAAKNNGMNHDAMTMPMPTQPHDFSAKP